MKKGTISSHFLLALFISFVSFILFATTSYGYGSAGTLKWRYGTDNEIYSSSPAIGPDGTVYVGSHDHYLYAINPDGTLKWKYETAWVFSSPAIGADGTVYVGSTDGYLYAINPDGTLKWRYWTGYICSSPAIGADGTVYVGSEDSYLYAINPDGTLKWQYWTGGEINSSPAIGPDGTVYVGSRYDYLYAINPDGSLKWRYDTGQPIYSSPAIGTDGTVYVGSFNYYFYAINPDGTLKWRYETGDMIVSSPAIGADGTVYVGSNDGYLYAINPDGTLKWRYETGSNIFSSPAIGADGTVYVVSNDGYLYAINPDGTLKWKYDTGDSFSYSSPAIGADGTVYVGSDDGYLYAINGDSGGLANSPWPMFHHDLRHTGRVGPSEGSFGYLSVSIEPAGARSAGAKWRVDGGLWHESGYTQYDIRVGEHTVEFKTITGWSRPSSKRVTIAEDEGTKASGTYIQTDTETCVLEGIVTGLDARGNPVGPLSGVRVKITGYGATDTDGLGAYRFSEVSPGTYQVTATKTGYYSSTREVTLEAGETRTEYLRLTEKEVTTSPTLFDFSSPDGKYFVPGMAGDIHFKTKVAWNGSPGSVRFLVAGQWYQAAITDLGGGKALAELSVPAPGEINSSSELTIEATNGEGDVGHLNTGVYFLPIFEFIPWYQGPFTWNSCCKLSLSYSDGHSWAWDLPLPSDDLGLSASLGYGMKFKYDLLSATLIGSLEGKGGLDFKIPTFNPDVKVLGEGHLGLSGELKASLAGDTPSVTPSWALSGTGKTGVEAPVVLALDSVAPGVGSFLAKVPVIKDIDLALYLDLGGKLTGIYEGGQSGDCWFGATSNTGTFTGDLEGQLSAAKGGFEVGVYAGGNGDFDVGLCPDLVFDGYTGKIYAGAYAKALGFKKKKEKAAKISWDFTQKQGHMARVMSMSAPGKGGAGETWQPIGRDPLKWGKTNCLIGKKTGRFMSNRSSKQTGKAVEEKVVENVTWLARPSIFADTAGTRILYSLHDTDKPWYAASDIAEVFQQGGNAFAMDRVTDDLASEFSPEIAGLGSGTLLGVWTRVSGDISGAQGPEDVAPHLEIVASFYDSSKKSWGSPVQLTQNDVVDRDPLPVVFGKKIGVIWIENQGKAMPGNATSGDSLMYAGWNGTSWEGPKTLWSGQKGILKSSFVSDGNNEGHVVMAVDEDGNLTTVTDQELYLVSTQNGVWQAAQRLTNDDVQDDLPVLVSPDGTPMLVWSSNSTLKYTTLTGWNPKDVYAQETLASKAPTLVGLTMPGGAAIAYTAQGPEGIDIVAAFYDSGLDQWSLPRKLTQDEDSERSLSMAWDGTDLSMAYLKTQTLHKDVQVELGGKMETIEKVPLPGRTDLYILHYTLGNDLAIAPGSVVFDPSNPAPGTTAQIHATIQNLGDLPAQDVEIVAYDGDPDAGGTQIGQTGIDNLVGGGSQQVTVSWDVPSDLNPHRIFVVVDPQLSLDDRDRSNNKGSAWTVLPDLVVETGGSELISGDQAALMAKIGNDGVIPSGLFRVSWRLGAVNGQELGSKEVETITPGSFREVTMVWDMDSDQLQNGSAIVYTVVDPENDVLESDETNNTHFQAVSASPALAVPGDCNGDGQVSIDDVQKCINCFLGIQNSCCDKCDLDGDGQVTIDEVQKVINAFLGNK